MKTLSEAMDNIDKLAEAIAIGQQIGSVSGEGGIENNSETQNGVRDSDYKIDLHSFHDSTPGTNLKIDDFTESAEQEKVEVKSPEKEMEEALEKFAEANGGNIENNNENSGKTDEQNQEIEQSPENSINDNSIDLDSHNIDLSDSFDQAMGNLDQTLNDFNADFKDNQIDQNTDIDQNHDIDKDHTQEI